MLGRPPTCEISLGGKYFRLKKKIAIRYKIRQYIMSSHYFFVGRGGWSFFVVLQYFA